MHFEHMLNPYTLRKQGLKITQLDEEGFTKVNEQKLTQIELF